MSGSLQETKAEARFFDTPHPWLSVLFFAVALRAGFLIWTSLNPLLMDLSGHIASAAAFNRGGLHHFNEQMFLGLTHNLFYPPLEDAIVALLHRITPGSMEDSFRVYLVVLSFIFLGSLERLAQSFRNRISAAMVGVSSLALFFLDKTASIRFQGLALSDLLVTGLSNQFIAGSAFFLLLREWIRPSSKSFRWVQVYLAVAVLSHIVVGSAAALVFAAIHWRRGSVRSFAGSAFEVAGWTAFYWLPFLLYRDYLSSSAIWLPMSALYSILAGVAVLSAFRRSRSASAVYLVAFVFWFISCFLHTFQDWLNVNGSLHDYRYSILALWVFVIGLAKEWESDTNRFSRFKVLVLFGLLAGQLSQEERLWWPGPNSFFLSPNAIRTRDEDFKSDPVPYSRVFVMGQYRSCDFGLDSTLAERYPQFRSTKGLFWESNYSNPIQSSYLATLFYPPMVLDHLFEPDLDCEQRGRVFEQYIRNYNIRTVITGETELNRLPEPVRSCTRQWIRTGLPHFRWVPTGSVASQSWEPETIYRLQFRVPLRFQPGLALSTVELLDPEQVKFVVARGKYPYFGDAVRSNFDTAKKTSTPASSVYVIPSESELLQELKAPSPAAAPIAGQGVEITALGNSRFEFVLPTHPTLFWLKLGAQPGLRIKDGAGNELSWIKALPGIIAKGSGRITVYFERTSWMWLSYLFSICAISATLIFRSRRKDV